jgi:hypothetical protein
MLILDDRLTLRVLLGLFDWLPPGFDSSDLATTPAVLYRLSCALYSERGFTRGVHSSMLSSLTAVGRNCNDHWETWSLPGRNSRRRREE